MEILINKIRKQTTGIRLAAKIAYMWPDRFNWIPFCLLLVTFSGCGDTAYPAGARYHFQPYVVLEGTDKVTTYSLPSDKSEQLDELLLPFFGTPREPAVKLENAQADLDTLQLSSEQMSLGSKLFLSQCALCHGKEGNGLGKSADKLDPKPRDFRHGKFKYVSTVRMEEGGHANTGQATYPSRADLFRTIKHGLPGSGMSSFNQDDKRIEALVSYVIHLALRGQVEYRLTRFWLEEDEKPNEKDVARELREILTQWAGDARHTVTPSVPWEEIEREGNSTQWAHGKQLFLGKAGCIDCHGKSGKALLEEVPSIAAMKDDWGKPIKPRSFVSDSFRGGDQPID
ncbi:MAG TPA: c-type cytochrome, partial [Gemmatales bacterium]|nr:c-type cytochrome [Gemmatales bacterium]